MEEITLQMPHLARMIQTERRHLAGPSGRIAFAVGLGARFRSSPNIDNPSFRSRCNALSRECVEPQRKAIQ
jgi:hypothetical protein